MKIFISYSKSDELYADKIFDELNGDGLDVWLDKVSLLPGQLWEHEIKMAIKNSDFVILILSNNSLDSRGYFQKEIKIAIDTYEEMPYGQIYLLPVRIDDCKVPEQLNEFHYIDIFKDEDWQIGFQKILISIKNTKEKLKKISHQKNESIKEHSRISPDFDLQKYKKWLSEQYGNLKLESFDTTGYLHDKLKLRKIFIPQNVCESHEFLPQVFEIPKKHQRKFKETGQVKTKVSEEEKKRIKEIYHEKPIPPVLEVVKDTKCRLLVILGDPGSGKSTLLQYLALEWSKKSTQDLLLYPLPLLIELRAYVRTDCRDFLEFYHENNVFSQLNQHQFEEYLKTGNALVMFDGLDEIFDSVKRVDVITQIHAFSINYPKIQIIVTSRVIGYRPQRLRDAKFRHFIIQDLENDQIETFIQKWYNINYNDESEKKRKQDRLKKAIDESASLRELAGNPLLLTMMAILNRNQELPRDRAELYNQVSRLLLHQWDIERTLIDKKLDPNLIDFKDKQTILRKIAFHMQNAENGLAGNHIHSEELEKIIIESLKSFDISEERMIARLLIRKLRTRNFILCHLGADYYAFVHRTFSEYFCAWEFVWQFEKEQKIDLEYLKNEVYGKHWQDESWHEVLRLIAGMIDAKFVGEIIEYLMKARSSSEKEKLFLAAECLAEVKNRSEILSVSKKIFDNISFLYKKGIWYERKDIVPVLARCFKHEPETVTFLKNVALSDKDHRIQELALTEFAKNFKHEPETLTFLKTFVQSCKNKELKESTVWIIGWIFKDAPETLTILKDIAQSDKDSDVRYKAIEELVNNFKDAPEPLTILKNIVQSDKNSYVRYGVLAKLARKFKDAPETLNILETAAKFDTDAAIRQDTIGELIENYPDNPKNLEVLKNRAKNDPDGKVREYAKKVLKEKFGEDV